MDRPEKQENKKAGMHVGVQGIGTSPKELAFLVRHGVTHMDASVENTETETLVQHKAEAAEAGVSLEMIHIGLPRSITLAQDPQRDRDIDAVCQMIENAAAASLRGLNYNFCISKPSADGEHIRTWRLTLQYIRLLQVR